MLLDGDGVVGTAFHGAVVGDNHAFDAGDTADTGDDAASGDGFSRVEIVAGERG